MPVVFVYGTLTDPAQVSTLLNTYQLGPAATCHGLQRVDGTYPTLAPGEQVRGRLLSTPEIERLDAYEGVDRGLYCRLSVPLAASVTADDNDASTDDNDASTDPSFDVDTAAVYIGDPTRLGVDGVEWPGSGSFAQRVDEYLDRNTVRIARDTTGN